MCLNPLHLDLSKRTKYFFPGYSQLINVDVPCCCCDECVSASQNDMFVRMKSEYDLCISKGGSVAFLTFTFNDFYISACRYFYNPITKDINFEKIQADSNRYDFIYCFDKKVVQRFFNTLRKYFERRGVKDSFRYFLVPEYGTDDRFTQRPHYHVLLYFSRCAYDLFCLKDGSFDEYGFMSYINSIWRYGMVTPSSRGLFLCNDDAICYVSKYISKTILLTKLNRFKNFRRFISTHLHELDPVDFKYNKNVDSLFKYYMKKSGSSLFVLKSKNFGISAIDELVSLRDSFKYDELVRKFQLGYSYVYNGEVKYKPFSMYYFRKLFYEFREDGSYFLTKHGFKFRSIIANDSIISLRDRINRLSLSLLDLKDRIFVNRCLSHKDFLTKFCLYSTLVRGRSFPKYVYRHLFSYFYNDSKGVEFSSIVDFCVTCNYGYIFAYDDYNSGYYLKGFSGFNFSDYKSMHPIFYSDAFYISYYEKFYEIINGLFLKSRIFKYESLSKQIKNSKLLREVINDFSY